MLYRADVSHHTGISHDRLEAMGREFATQKGLSEYADVFAKGAVLAQDPLQFESLEQLSEEDKRVIRREVTHKVRSSLARVRAAAKFDPFSRFSVGPAQGVVLPGQLL